jgi:two-component system, LuxR family, sensor kinase FixL
LPTAFRKYNPRLVLFALAYVGAYVAADWLTHVRAVLPMGITPWNPGAGMSLAFLLYAGLPGVPIVAGAILVAEIANHALRPNSPALLLACCWIAVVYGGVAQVLRRQGLLQPILSTSGILRLIGGCACAALLASIGFVGSFIIAGEIAPREFLYAATRYCFADLNGMIMVTPLLVPMLARRGIWGPATWHPAAFLLQCVAILLTMLLLFALPAADQLRFFYLLFVPIIWIALQGSLAGAVFAVLLTHIVLIVAARLQIHAPRFVDLQVMMLTLSLTALLLGAVVSDRRRTEEQLRERDMALGRAMRFAVAGELASALTHELTQPITALASYVQASRILAVRAGAAEPRLLDALDKAVDAATRSSEVLRRLRDFYKGGALKSERIALAPLLARVVQAFQERLRGANVSLEVTFETRTVEVEGDPMQLEIVLHNLLGNAIDALQQSNLSGRRVEITVSSEGRTIVLTMEDSGTGIPPAVAPRLFEPFVTGKSDGMGLGLAISQSLVRAWDGELLYAPGKKLGGACFMIRLPAASSAPDATKQDEKARR